MTRISGHPTRTTTRTAARTATALGAAAALVVGLGAAPAGAGPSEGLAEPRLDRLAERVVASGAIGVTARYTSPEGSWATAAGRADVDPEVPATPDDAFRAASVSKQLVAVLVLQLVDQGRWSLDTTLGEVAPDLWPEKSAVTVRQLLSHTGGVPEFLPAVLGQDPSTEAFLRNVSQPRTDAELVAAARTLPSPPVGEYSYSNTGYVLLGMMLARQSGRRVAELVQERVLAPTGMTRSSWPSTPDLGGPALREHARLYGQVVSFESFDPSTFSAAGALVSTTRDLDKFQRALSRGELVSPRLVREMRTPVDPDNPLGIQYGLGSYSLADPCVPGGRVHGHDGGSFATVTLSFSSPDGSRRVQASMTGRDYDGGTASLTALSDLLDAALLETCADPLAAGTTAPDGPRWAEAANPVPRG